MRGERTEDRGLGADTCCSPLPAPSGLGLGGEAVMSVLSLSQQSPSLALHRTVLNLGGHHDIFIIYRLKFRDLDLIFLIEDTVGINILLI